MEEIEKPIIKRVEPVMIEGYSEIPGVQFNGNATYRIFDILTDLMTLPDLSKYSREQKKAGNPYVVGAQEDWAIKTAIANSGDEKLIADYRERLKKTWTRVLTAIDWYSNGNSRVIHNVDTPDAYSIQGGLIGPDGFISKTKPKKLLENVLGTDNIEEINNVSQKINLTPMCLSKVDYKPDKTLRTGVEFGAYSGGLNLYCDWDPLIRYRAFRVLRID